MKKIYNFLMMFVVAATACTGLMSCDEDDQYIADQLRNRDWQGYIGTYYQDRWGLSGSDYATVMHFTSKDAWYTSGRGEELDYDTRSPHSDYAYCTFKWFIVDGEITLIYDDSMWQPIYIIDYSLNGSRFRGYIYDGTNRRIQFDLRNEGYEDWGYYNNSGSYGGFSNQNYYRSRSLSPIAGDGEEPLPVIDRTEQARQESGEPTAASVLSGAFAIEH